MALVNILLKKKSLLLIYSSFFFFFFFTAFCVVIHFALNHVTGSHSVVWIDIVAFDPPLCCLLKKKYSN